MQDFKPPAGEISHQLISLQKKPQSGELPSPDVLRKDTQSPYPGRKISLRLSAQRSEAERRCHSVTHYPGEAPPR